MDFILVLFICLSLSYLLSWFFRKMGLPSILGHLTTGLIVSYPAISSRFFEEAATIQLFESLSNLGLIMLLFFIGMKINIHKLIKFSNRSLNVAFLSTIIPFFLGFLFGRIIGLDYVASMILGACISVTAEAVSGAILEEMNMLNSYIGITIIEAGITTMIFDMIFIATIGAHISSGETFGIVEILYDIFIFIALIYLVRFIFIPVAFNMLGKKPSHTDLFTTSFIVVLLMAAISNYLEFGEVIGALIAGVFVKQTLIKEHRQKQESDTVDLIKTITFGFLEPIFFIYTAYSADIFQLNSEITHFFEISLALIVIATGGKLLGSILGNLVDKGTVKDGVIMGWGMNAKGAVEIIAAKMALNANLINEVIYSSIILMTFVTTIISPIIFKYVVTYHKPLSKKDDINDEYDFQEK